jgi:hypothetical protein
MTTLNTTSPSTTTPVAACAMAKLATQTISSMMALPAPGRPRARSNGGKPCEMSAAVDHETEAR